MLNYRNGLDAIPVYDTKEEQCWNIKVNANESNVGLPPLVEERLMTRVSRAAFQRYPLEEYDSLREMLGETYGYQKDNIIIGNGSSEIIEKAFYCFGGSAEHKIVYPSPSFSMYGIYVQVANASGISVPLREDYTLCVDTFIQTINDHKASLAVLCNPNNPTGQVLTQDQIEYIASNISSAFLIDEAYVEFYGPSSITLLRKYPNIMVARTFSKAYALASCRVGYMIANTSIINMLAKTYMPYHMNTLSLLAADTVFEMRDQFEPQIQMICEERERMQEKYSRLPGITAYPSNTNFILIHHPRAEALNRMFIEYGIGVRSFGVGSHLEKHLRISIGRPDENDEIIRVTQKFLEENS